MSPETKEILQIFFELMKKCHPNIKLTIEVNPKCQWTDQTHVES